MSPDDHVVTNAAMVGGGSGHTTTMLRSTKIPDENGGMVLWDTWGVSDPTHTASELRLLLNGLLANKWNMDSCERLIEKQDDLERAINTAPSRRQHAVLFLFPYTLFGDEKVVDQRIRDSQHYFKEFLKQNIQPLIIITQAGAACPVPALCVSCARVSRTCLWLHGT